MRVEKTHSCVVCGRLGCHNAGRACVSWCGAYYQRRTPKKREGKKRKRQDERCIKRRWQGKRTQRMKYLITEKIQREIPPLATLVPRNTSLERTFCLSRKKRVVSVQRSTQVEDNPIPSSNWSRTHPTVIHPIHPCYMPNWTHRAKKTGIIDRRDIDAHHVVVFLRILCRRWYRCKVFASPLRLRAWEGFGVV